MVGHSGRRLSLRKGACETWNDYLSWWADTVGIALGVVVMFGILCVPLLALAGTIAALIRALWGVDLLGTRALW